MKRILLILVVFIFACQLRAQNSNPSNYIYFGGNENVEPTRQIEDGGTLYVEIEYNFPCISTSEKISDGKLYHYIHIQGFGKMGAVGKPAVPAHTDIVLFPSDEQPEITILETEVQILGGYNIHPALEPAHDTYGALEPEFRINHAIYNTDEFYPANPVEIIDVQHFREAPLGFVQIRPIQYNPVTKQIKVYTRIKYRLVFNGSSRIFTEIAENNSKNYTNMLKNYILNNHNIPDGVTHRESRAGEKNYIIITHSQYLNQANDLAEWKRQLGYSVEVVSQSSWTAAQVKTAIHDRYSLWTPKPDYFVIIGDHAGAYAVPGEIKQTPDSPTIPDDPYDFATDLYYACMDGGNDYVPDMAHGRISVSSSTEATTAIEKIINYEKYPVTDASYYTNGLNCAQYQDDDNNGFADRRFCHTSEEIRDYVISQGYSVDRIYYTDSPWNITDLHYNNGQYSNGQLLPAELRNTNFDWNGGETDITTAINSGKFYVFHRDHGYSGGSGWAHPEYTTTSMNNLTNGNLLPIVFSMNCHTGEFLLDNCFAEKFIRMQNSGALGVIAASNYSYSGYNDGLSIGMIDAIWHNPGLTPNFGTGGVSNPPGSSPTSDILTMGNVLNQGLIRMIETWGGTFGIIYTHELFHYFGDPAMKIWTENPNNNTITASHGTLHVGSTSLIINNCNSLDGLATLLIGNELVGDTFLNGGTGVICFSALTNTYPTATLTISNLNSKPFLADILIEANNINSNFTATPVSGNAPLEVNFTNQSTGNITSYLWNFGDGSTSTSENPEHTYQSSGSYDVSLTISDGVNQDTETKFSYIQVLTPTEPTLSNGFATPNPGTSGETFSFYVTYTDPSGNTPSDVKLKFTTYTYSMNYVSGNVTSGAIYKYEGTISSTGTYAFHFEANSGQQRFPETVGQFLYLNVNQSTVGWDIRITEIDASPDPLPSGGDVDVDVRIHNNSNHPSYIYDDVDYDICLYSPSGNLIDSDSGTTGTIGQGEYEDINGEVTVPSQSGIYTITATIYPDLDENYSDNTMSTTIYVGTSGDVEKYLVPQSHEVVQWSTGNSNQFQFNGNSYYLHTVTDDYIRISTNNNIYDSEKIYENNFKLFSNDNTMIINQYCDHSTSYGDECWMSFASKYYDNDYNIDIPQVSGYKGETISIHAHSNNIDFSNNDPDFYNNSNVEDWYDDYDLENSDTDYYAYFDIPTNQSTGNYNFYIDLKIDSPGSWNEHLIQKCRITVLSSPPNITSLSVNSFSADDIININGTNLGSSGTIKFGTLNCPTNNIQSWDNSSIELIVPEGIQNGTLIVTNSYGTSNGISYNIISSTGDPELVQPIPDQTMPAGTTKLITDLSNNFWDPNNDVLNYEVTYSSNNISHTITNSELSITANDNISESVVISVEATDADNATVTDEFILVINDINDPPSVIAIPDQSFNEDDTLTIQYSYFNNYVSDPDNSYSELSYNIIDYSPLSINSIDSNYVITAPANWHGTATPTFTVSDSQYTTSKVFTIEVISIPEEPIVETLDATNVLALSAQLNGTINPNGFLTNYYFEYGETQLYGNSTPTMSLTAGMNTIGVSELISGLEQGTEYHFQLVAINDDGTSYGGDKTFTTLSEQVIVVNYVIPDTSTTHIIYENETLSFEFSGYDPDGNPLEYAWALDDSVLTNEIDSTYLHETDYNSAGVHSVTLDVTDNFGTKNSLFYEWTVTVEDVPRDIVVNYIIPDTATTNTIDENETLSFEFSGYDPDGNDLVYTWKIDDDIVQGQSDSIYKYTPDYESAGNHTISLVVTDDPGSKNTLNYQWQVHVNDVDRPIVVTSVNPDTSSTFNMEEGTSQQFYIVGYDPDGNPLEYLWELDDLLLTNENDSIYAYNPTYTDSGMHTIDLLVKDNYTRSSLSYSWDVHVNDVDQTIFVNYVIPDTANVQEVNERDTLPFVFSGYDPDGNPIGYRWELDDLLLTNMNDSIYAYTPTSTDSGMHTVELLVKDNYTRSSLSYSWDVHVNDVDQEIIVNYIIPDTANVQEINERDSLLFEFSGYDPDGNPLEYLWELDDSLLTNEDDSIYAYTTTSTDSGMHAVDLLVKDNYTRSSLSYSWDVHVNDVDQTIFVNYVIPDTANLQEVNERDTLMFEFSGYDPDGNPLEYDWELDDSLLTNANDSIYAYYPTYSDSGMHTVDLLVKDNYTRSSLSYSWDVYVFNVPIPGRISGYVSLYPGGPGEVEDVELIIDTIVLPIHPDTNGYYITDELIPGPYNITASLQDYFDSTKVAIEVCENDTTENVNFTLDPKPILRVEPTDIDLGILHANDPFSESFIVGNDGPGILSGTISESENVDWITYLSPDSFNLLQDEEVTVLITGNAPADLGEFETYIYVNANIDNDSVYVHGYTGATGIIFTYTNDEITIEGDDILLNYDVMIQASESDTKFGSGMVYIDYDTDLFGENICANNNITVTKGEILEGEFVPGANLYTILAVADNTSSKFAVATSYDWFMLPDYANELTIEPIQYLHISMCINTLSQSCLYFDNGLMEGQQYFSDETTLYIPVIANDSLRIDDIPPPPENVVITIIGTNVHLNWDTVTGATSYKVYSSDNPHTGFTEDTTGTFIDESWSAPVPDEKKFYYVKAVN